METSLTVYECNIKMENFRVATPNRILYTSKDINIYTTAIII